MKRKTLIAVLWAEAFFLIAFGFLAIVAPSWSHQLALPAVVCVGTILVVIRLPVFSTIYSHRPEITSSQANAIRWCSRLLLILASAPPGMYLAAQAGLLAIEVHHNAVFALFGYFTFLVGKWLLVPPLGRPPG